MKLADLTQETTTSTGAPFVLAGAIPGARPFSATFSVGDAQIAYCVREPIDPATGVRGPNFLLALGTLQSGNQLSVNAVLTSSAGTAVPVFGSGPNEIFSTAPASAFASTSTVIAFSSTIPFTGDLDMGTMAVTADIAFTPNMLGAIRNGSVALSLKADGAHNVTFAGFVQDNTSDGWNNHANLVHRIVFFYDGLTTLPGVAIYQVPNPAAAPVIGTATLVGSNVSQAFTPPTNDNGSTVTGYIVTASPSGVTASGAASPVVLTGLPVGAATTQTVQAVNAKGPGLASAASNSVTVPASSVPGAPTSVAAVGGAQEATVSWAAPASTGGSAITGYTVTPQTTPGQAAPGNTTPVTVGNVLKAVVGSRQYFEHQSFTVKAINATGAGADSVFSNDLQLQTYPDQFFSPTGLTETTVSGLKVYTGAASGAYAANYSATANDFSQCHIAANVNGAVIATHSAMAAGRGSVAFVSNNGAVNEAGALLSVGIEGTNFVARVAGSQVATATGAGSTGTTQIRRRLADGATGATATLTAEYSGDGGYAWTVFYTLTNQPQTMLYAGIACKDIGAITVKVGY